MNTALDHAAMSVARPCVLLGHETCTLLRLWWRRERRHFHGWNQRRLASPGGM